MATLKPPAFTSALFELPGEIPPRGAFVATCLDVRDVFGITRKKYQSDEDEKVDLTAFLFGFRTSDGQSFKIATKPMRISGSEKSALFVFLTAWLGRAPRYGWDYCELKGRTALITIDHRASSARPGVVYAVISSVAPVPEGFGQEPPPPTARPPVDSAPCGGTSSISTPAPSVEDAGDELPF